MTLTNIGAFKVHLMVSNIVHKFDHGDIIVSERSNSLVTIFAPIF